MKTLIIALASLLLSAGTAFSHEHEKNKDHRSEWREKLLKQYDKNGDGNLDDEERTAMKKAWAKKWKNRRGGWGKHHKQCHKYGDGKCNHDEHHTRHKKQWGNHDKMAKSKFISYVQNRVFDKIDQNDDGKLDIKKIVAKMQMRLNKIDTSDDGFIDRSEFKAITSPPPVKQADSSEQPDDVQAELARLRQAIEKLAESLKDRE